MNSTIKIGYKQTEIGIIPEDWDVKYFGEICSPSKARINPLTTNEELKCIELEHLSQETGRLLGYIDIRELKSQKSIFKKGDVLFGKLRPYLKKYLFAEFDGVCTTEIWVLKAYSEIQSKWLFYLVQSKQIIDAANQSTGTKMPRAEWKTVSATLIPLPPTKAEQTAIATVLSDADALISSLEKLIEKKQDIKQGAMQELLAPKEGWITKTLSEIGILKNGINKASEDFGFGYPFVNLLDVFGETKISTNEHLGLINSNASERKMYNLIKGDVLFIRSSVKPEGVGLTSVIERDLEDTVFSGFIIRFRDFGFLSHEFKEYCFNSYDFRNSLIASSSVSANTNINQESLKKLTLCYPESKSEQTRIAIILSDIDAEITILEHKLDKYKMLKQGMMQELLSGNIRLL